MASDFTSIDSLGHFLHAIGRYPHLSPVEERRLVERTSQGDAGARQQLVECNLRLVVAIAKDHRNDGLSFLDVIQEGVLGLIGAVDTFRPDLGNGFSSYASWCIKRAIRDAISDSRRVAELVPDETDPDPGATEMLDALEALPERPRRILELRYGLDGSERRSYTAIGRELGICKERVRQIELRALHALRTRPELLGRGDIVA